MNSRALAIVGPARIDFSLGSLFFIATAMHVVSANVKRRVQDAQTVSLLEFGLLAEGPHVPCGKRPRLGEPPCRHLRLRELRAGLYQAQSESRGTDARPRRQRADRIEHHPGISGGCVPETGAAAARGSVRAFDHAAVDL